jgi:hypothetical protein
VSVWQSLRFQDHILRVQACLHTLVLFFVLFAFEVTYAYLLHSDSEKKTEQNAGRLTSPCTMVSICTTCSNIHKLRIFPTHRICVFPMVLTKNSDSFPVSIGLCHEDSAFPVRYELNLYIIRVFVLALTDNNRKIWCNNISNIECCVEFEVLTAVVMKSSIFCDITLCSSLEVDRRFGETCSLHLNGRIISQARNQSESSWQAEREMEATCSSETSINF